ncbi:hypothetical protein [Aquimarina algiphila]|uniref:hypothetical protein n=1 Tax=Aquimarina algiphila TaxID=2047982 RepID=UPI0024933D16|nr:hypothetical protein [Aquimarina algiphila]
MLKNILNLRNAQTLSKSQQKSIHGGRTSNCPTYPPEDCLFCGGGPRPNGCCMGSVNTHLCLNSL